MEQKQRFFIHDRKEAAILVLLAVMVAIFAFTLGIHLGKRVASSKGAAHPLTSASPLSEAPESEPEVVSEPNAAASGGASAENTPDESASQALHDEVARTGIKLDQPRQVELPEKAASENGGATTGASASETSRAGTGPVLRRGAKDRSERHAEDSPEAEAAASGGRPARGAYSLQVGSFATRGEARAQASALSQQGINTTVQAARVPGKGMRYRVFAGGYASRDEAQKAGEKFSSEGMIDSYIVSRSGKKH